jgi:hypothetical protein
MLVVAPFNICHADYLCRLSIETIVFLVGCSPIKGGRTKNDGHPRCMRLLPPFAVRREADSASSLTGGEYVKWQLHPILN